MRVIIHFFTLFLRTKYIKEVKKIISIFLISKKIVIINIFSSLNSDPITATIVNGKRKIIIKIKNLKFKGYWLTKNVKLVYLYLC